MLLNRRETEIEQFCVIATAAIRFTYCNGCREAHVPRMFALKASKAFTTIESLCGGAAGSPKQQAAMARYRARADKNWWAALKAFAMEDEVSVAFSVVEMPQSFSVRVIYA